MNGRVPFLAADWRAIFLTQGLDHLDAWWQRVAGGRATLMDEPNYRYGGESRVYRIALADVEGREQTLYVKCQRDQLRRNRAHPLRGTPTLMTEFRALQDCLARGIPVARPLFFDTRQDVDGHRYTVLVSLGLVGFESLDRIDIAGLTAARRHRLIDDVADTLVFMHGHRYLHRHLYANHIFVAWRPMLERFDVCFIDLENARRVGSRRRLLRDLDSLARRSGGFGSRDRLRFLHRYLGVTRLDESGKVLARRLARRTGKMEAATSP